jgi:putative hydrolase of the HAD superfamily
MITIIAFDADDTLWFTEKYFQTAQDELGKLLSEWKDSENIHEILLKTEKNNLPLYGYGVKGFVLSMIQAAIQISGGEISADSIAQILTIGRKMLEAEMVLLPHVLETLQNLASKYRMMVITKGDLLHQNAKVKTAGLTGFFDLVEVVSEKTPETYKTILDKYKLNPRAFLMVGNSLRSDILPVLELGGKAVHIPAHTTWALEMVSNFDVSQENFYELEHMGGLPELVEELTKSFK